jgi:hypothetical protein
MPDNKTEKPGSEIAADAKRDDDNPKYGGKQWDVAEERGEQRFGVARNDDGGTHLDSTDQVTEGESGGERAGMARGEAPRKPKSRTK